MVRNIEETWLIIFYDRGETDELSGFYMLWTGERGVRGESQRFRSKLGLLDAWVKDELIFKL